MYNVICMKWGTRYDASYVNKLYSMVKKNTNHDIRFCCLTDDKTGISSAIECFAIPEITVPKEYAISPWRKLSLFKYPLYDIIGKTLFLDLDLVIVDNIDEFFTYSDNFAIIENWTQLGKNIGNSSVFCYEIGLYKQVYETYMQDPMKILTSYDNEQVFLSKTIKNLVFWPEHWCKSFKRHCIRGFIMSWFKAPILPAKAKIIVFHGDPKPEHAVIGVWPKKIFKHLKPCLWVKEYWH